MMLRSRCAGCAPPSCEPRCTPASPLPHPLPSSPPPCRPDPQAAPAMTAPQVLQSTEQVLENAGSVKHPAELARMYLRQLQFVLDQVQS